LNDAPPLSVGGATICYHRAMPSPRRSRGRMPYSLTDDEIRLLKELRGPASAVALFLKRR